MPPLTLGFWGGVQPRHYPHVTCRESVQPERNVTRRCPSFGRFRRLTTMRRLFSESADNGHERRRRSVLFICLWASSIGVARGRGV
ncbi:hypothetical protein F384_10185 [Citrobacter amalonaticus Y19]|uniref:Uncharacterized protein n=1 Tax=Citrobacter amalonaticus Y19 TaxID=1261127 RepID=A0A0F6REZ8_CITAM|nr:hypothetical protein F384_10185 [Citrobacter amalonaticus Y19]